MTDNIRGFAVVEIWNDPLEVEIIALHTARLVDQTLHDSEDRDIVFDELTTMLEDTKLLPGVYEMRLAATIDWVPWGWEDPGLEPECHITLDPIKILPAVERDDVLQLINPMILSHLSQITSVECSDSQSTISELYPLTSPALLSLSPASHLLL